ncbi:MAG: sulfurase [Acidimicrobiaceae bacterium]|nr:sulfurase [Acidimicrobiaceae bacterium]
MRVVEIWRYPVKSLGGETLDTAEVGPDGIVGDRMWGLRDRETQLVLTARREPELLFLTASLGDDGRPIITDADGAPLPDDAALSDRVGRPVELVAAADGPATFENPLNVDDETDWMQWQSAGRTFHDGRSTVSIVSTVSLGDWDRRRFRANVVVDEGGEDALSGTVTIGTARLALRKPLERCVMVTRAQPGIERDRGVLKQVVADRDNKMGVGTIVESPGRIAVGDEVVAG